MQHEMVGDQGGGLKLQGSVQLLSYATRPIQVLFSFASLPSDATPRVWIVGRKVDHANG